MRHLTLNHFHVRMAAALLCLLTLAACSKSGSNGENQTPAEPKHAERLGVWTEDYAAAVQQAKTEHKQILLDFTGSDWCVNCWNLDDGVFSKPAFADYAKSHWVLVSLDFPIRRKMPENVTDQNMKLMEKFGVEGLPTIVLLDANENKLAMMVGYRNQTPQQFIDELEHPKPAAAGADAQVAPMPPAAAARP